ncbi:MAG: cyclic nucleotide-binding domain-containing protein [Deltaproteobacteria bacterium]|nr:cyclic nucleotide-binding domain-containing protein [Deltaproteobacteria bacterium]
MVDPKTLRGMTFFADLNDDELNAIASIISKKNFKVGDVIFRENEDGPSLYLIKKGEVKACKATPEGELLTLTLMKDGDIFGEMSFLDERPHSASIVAIADTEVYTISKAEFENMVEKQPRMVYKLMRQIIFNIHTIVRGMNAKYMEMVNYMWGRKRG